MRYRNELTELTDAPPILADYPEFVEPLQADRRLLAPPLVDEPEADLLVRCWRWWYNARGIVEMENRLQAAATAVLIVHPWGIDDGHGLRTPEPAGVAFFCTREKNLAVEGHVRQVINPFLRRLRPHVAAVGYSLPGVEDEIRRLLYASALTAAEQLDPERGERLLAEKLAAYRFAGEALVAELELDDACPVGSYLAQTPSTEAGDRYNGEGYWQLPMPVHSAVERAATDLVFYDAEGYAKVRDHLRGLGVRHVLLGGYATDMCVGATTCGYMNLRQDFNVFLIGDATQATYPGSVTPRFATQVALANAALTQLVSQCSWVRLAR